MNPNFDNSNGSDQEPDQSDPNEAGENELSFSTSDYPELEGLQPGAAVQVTCQATVGDASNGQITFTIDPGQCEFKTEGQADKAFKEMSGQDAVAAPPSNNQGGDF